MKHERPATTIVVRRAERGGILFPEARRDGASRRRRVRRAGLSSPYDARRILALYAVALQKVPLSLAQPVITGGASVVTAVVSVWLLRESMGAVNWLGLALVCLGLYLLFAGRL